MQYQSTGKFNCLLVHGGAILLLCVLCVCSDAMNDKAAWQMLRRVGGYAENKPGPGYGRIVKAFLFGASPSAADLSTLVPLRSLQVVDLSMSQIGDRELLALVECRVMTTIVPDGRTSPRAQERFGAGRIVIGLPPDLPGSPKAANRERAKSSPEFASTITVATTTSTTSVNARGR